MDSATQKVTVIIPALNEEASLPLVLQALPKRGLEYEIVEIFVVDNGSTDNTAAVALAHGSRVISEPRRGYGQACLAGIAALEERVSRADLAPPDVVVFLDADFSDHPQELPLLLEPIFSEKKDLVIGSRIRGESEPGALYPQAQWGNRLACFFIRVFFGFRYTDLGPFRAIRYRALLGLDMCDQNFGWTVEMQVRAILNHLEIGEVAVSYRHRVGVSKITGTVRGTLLAGAKILGTIFYLKWRSLGRKTIKLHEKNCRIRKGA